MRLHLTINIYDAERPVGAATLVADRGMYETDADFLAAVGAALARDSELSIRQLAVLLAHDAPSSLGDLLQHGRSLFDVLQGSDPKWRNELMFKAEALASGPLADFRARAARDSGPLFPYTQPEEK